jgi:biopolymer transport protein ExbB
MNLLAQGGPVLWLIIGCGIAAAGVFFERLLHLRRAGIDPGDFLKGIRNVLGKGNTGEAIAICEETPGPVAALVRAAIMHRQEARHAIREAVDTTGRAEISRLDRRLATLATISQVAPLLGLLGTILGILETVLVMHEQVPLVDATAVTGGLLRALITSAAGLMVAIPCYGMYNLLVVRIDRMVLDMETAAGEIVAFLTAAAGDDRKDAQVGT